MDGKIGVNAGQAGKEMTFPSVDIFFDGVGTMDMRRHNLEGKRDGLHVTFDAMRALIVQDL